MGSQLAEKNATTPAWRRAAKEVRKLLEKRETGSLDCSYRMAEWFAEIRDNPATYGGLSADQLGEEVGMCRNEVYALLRIRARWSTYEKFMKKVEFLRGAGNVSAGIAHFKIIAAAPKEVEGELLKALASGRMTVREMQAAASAALAASRQTVEEDMPPPIERRGRRPKVSTDPVAAMAQLSAAFSTVCNLADAIGGQVWNDVPELMSGSDVDRMEAAVELLDRCACRMGAVIDRTRKPLAIALKVMKTRKGR